MMAPSARNTSGANLIIVEALLLMTQRLEQYYPGDSAWKRFVEVCSKGCSHPPSDPLIAAVCGHRDIATVILTKIGHHAIAWIDTKTPALDGLTAKDCLKEPHLLKRLRTMLMRMP